MGKRIYSLEYFKKLAIKRDGLCLSKNFISVAHKLKFQCANGHIWETKPYYLVHNNSWCPKCQKNYKDNIETFHEIAKERNGKCLSNKYVNAKSKLKFKCSKDHIWESTAHDIKYSKTWCPVCANSVKLTIKNMQEIAKKRGGECLSDKYVNSHTKLKWKCRKGHIWKAKPYLVKNSKNWCPDCSSTKKMTIENMQEIAKKRDGECLSDKYVNSTTKLLWKCNKGHQWLTTPKLVKNSKSWCPICAESSGERFVDDYLNQHKINHIYQYSFDNLKSDSKRKTKLRFDFYLPDYNILIEYDGKQHFEAVNFGGCSNEAADDAYLKLKGNDEIKNEYSRKNNIHLIRISYKIKDIEKYLEEKIDEYI